MKKIFSKSILIFFAFNLTAFEWPVKEFNSEGLNATFAQNRKQHFNTSQIFPEAQEVVATDKGNVTVIILEHQNDGDWFESTLGNCVIIAHQDHLISVYGNLKKEDTAKFSRSQNVFSGERLGEAENSAWNDTPSSLEFQIADTEDKVFLNPLILMPRVSKMSTPSLDGVTLENRLGRSYELASTRSVQAGMYKVYKNRRKDFPAHDSAIFLNGTELEKISKDILSQENGTLSISSHRTYTNTEFYPDATRELLGRIVIPHGANTLAITVKNILENEKTSTYNIQGF